MAQGIDSSSASKEDRFRWIKLLIVILLTSVIQRGLDVLLPPRAIPSPQSPIAAGIPLNTFKLLVVSQPLLAILFARKNMALPYALAYLVPIVTWYSANLGKYWTIIWLVFGIIPLLELISGEDTDNPTKEEERVLNERVEFKLITMMWAPVQTVFLLWAAWAVSVWDLTWSEFILFSISIGFNTGVLGINIAHELIHKANSLEQWLGKILLVEVCYGHFFVEHIWGHHKRVSTPYDAATAQYGENFYSFWVKSVVGSFRSAWHIEALRLKKRGRNVWSIYNQMLHFIGLSALIAFSLYVTFGKNALIMFAIQSVIAFTLLEVVNYIEHYGLARKKVKDIAGAEGYEPVNVMHSWNANARVTNFFLFKLQRHSDHHAFAGRRYQILRSFEESPQMPTGYAGMVLLALFPPLWFALMNPRVQAFHNKNSMNTKLQ